MVSSPLRYPGGKAKLFPFFSQIIEKNDLFGCTYSEPYAGGSGLAIRLLSAGYVDRIRINDLDRSIYAFWLSAIKNVDAFCRLIERTPVTIDEWYKQRDFWRAADDSDLLVLGFSAYFLNRTNRSGIIEGAGPIGGYAQSGAWKIDVRLDKQKQIDNIRSLSRYSDQIEISNLDAEEFMNSCLAGENELTYLDPPYFVKGKKLYKNFYNHDDHARISKILGEHRSAKWIVSYDDVEPIRRLYDAFDPVAYALVYSAGQKGIGREVMYASDALILPERRGFASAA